MKHYTNKFFSATTPLTLIPLFILANSIKQRRFNIVNYMLLAPIYLGLLNVIVYYLFRLSDRYHYILITIISIICSYIIVSTIDSYNFTEQQWKLYYKMMIIGHFLFWYVGVQNVELIFF
jgi:hypothetical protein